MSYLVFLTDTDDGTAPPEQLLGVAVVGDDVFLSIEKYDETFDTRSFTTVGYVKVPKRELVLALVSADEDTPLEAVRYGLGPTEDDD